MDKFITLCFDCRALFKEHYRLEAYDTETALPSLGDRAKKKPVACENCEQRFDLRVCRVRTKPKEG